MPIKLQQTIIFFMHWTTSMVRYLFCAIIALLSGCQAVPRAASWPVEPEVSVRWVNDYPMAFTDRGTGPTVVFVHGVLTDYRVWQKPLENWLKDYRVIAVSLRHFYPEIWNGKANDFTYQQHAKDLARFIETLGGPVHLVGWSFGGMPAYMVARDRPDLVRKLVLVEGGPDFRVQADGVPSNADPIKRAAVTEKFFQAGDIDGGLRFAVNDISGPGRWDALSESYRQSIRENAWTVVGIGREALWRASCSEFQTLKMPVLLMWGELTTPRLRGIVEAQAECLKTASIVKIPRTGHGVAAGNPQAFHSEATSFLGR
jgi:pimeloyl-ACP methyl ester carboxylesterase